MKVILYNAVSIDGFIAGLKDETSWIDDYELFGKKVADVGAVIVGRRSYELCMTEGVFPFSPTGLHIVASHSHHPSNSEQIIFSSASPPEMIAMLEKKGFTQVLVAGGGNLNGSFLKAGLIDELYLDLHPHLVGQGIRLFENVGESELKLELLTSKKFPTFTQLHYRVIK